MVSLRYSGVLPTSLVSRSGDIKWKRVFQRFLILEIFLRVGAAYWMLNMKASLLELSEFF